MASDDQAQATLRDRSGGSVDQPVPYPLPEAVLQIAQVARGGPPAPGQLSPDRKWGTRVFLMAGGTSEAPIYQEDERYPEPTYEEASYVRIQCRECKAEPPLLFVKAYPRQKTIDPANAYTYCHEHYIAKYS